MKILHTNLVCAMVAMALGAVVVVAADSKAPSLSFPVLSQATQVELPAKAAALISKTDAKHREQMTIDVVKAALGLNPAAAPNVVASIARTNPDMAALAAATAAILLPDKAAEIARVAAAAAPKKAGQIVAAVCRVAPKHYREIANAVAEAVPNQGKQILAGLSSALPMLEAPLNKIIAAYNGSIIPSVSTVLNQVPANVVIPTTGATTPEIFTTPPTTTDTAPTIAIAPPTFGPPYVIPPGSHVNLDPGAGTNVPPGGRDYASP